MIRVRLPQRRLLMTLPDTLATVTDSLVPIKQKQAPKGLLYQHAFAKGLQRWVYFMLLNCLHQRACCALGRLYVWVNAIAQVGEVCPVIDHQGFW